MDRGSNEVLVLFSGGTDSTLAAALMAQQYKKVHLVTYDRFGFFGIKNSKINVNKLKNIFGDDKFTFKITKYNNLAKYVFYEKYWHNVMKYGFFMLSTCGLCKLAMHIKTIDYCLKNKVYNVCDGANKGMYLFPAQMKDVILEVKNMYSKFGINYTNPVFHFDGHQDAEFADLLHMERIFPNTNALPDIFNAEKGEKNTAGRKLCSMGIMHSNNVKGTELDRKIQARCFQFILFNIFVKWYYLHNNSYDKYQQETVNFYKDKISNLTSVVEDYARNGRDSRYANIFSG